MNHISSLSALLCFFLALVVSCMSSIACSASSGMQLCGMSTKKTPAFPFILTPSLSQTCHTNKHKIRGFLMEDASPDVPQASRIDLGYLADLKHRDSVRRQ